MSEQASTQSPEQYLSTHPNAITDPAKAEVMAYASQDYEEAVVKLGNKAIDAAILAASSDEVVKSSDKYMTIEMVPLMREVYAKESQESLEGAKLARNKADENAETTASLYDTVKDIKQGKPSDS